MTDKELKAKGRDMLCRQIANVGASICLLNLEDEERERLESIMFKDMTRIAKLLGRDEIPFN